MMIHYEIQVWFPLEFQKNPSINPANDDFGFQKPNSLQSWCLSRGHSQGQIPSTPLISFIPTIPSVYNTLNDWVDMPACPIFPVYSVLYKIYTIIYVYIYILYLYMYIHMIFIPYQPYHGYVLYHIFVGESPFILPCQCLHRCGFHPPWM